MDTMLYLVFYDILIIAVMLFATHLTKGNVPLVIAFVAAVMIFGSLVLSNVLQCGG